MGNNLADVSVTLYRNAPTGSKDYKSNEIT